MSMSENFEKIFETDKMSKRERVEATLLHQPVDRVAILEQLSYNPGVISMYTGKEIKDFNYTLDDICEVIRKTTDLIMPPCAPLGKDQLTTDDGFIFQNDNWTRWHVSRPFNDEVGARDWLIQQTLKLHEQTFDRDTVRQEYRDYMTDLQSKIGDTVILNYSYTRMCTVYDSIGLEIFTFFHLDYPEVLNDYMQIAVEQELQRIHAVADKALTPVVLIPEDFATKQGPIFAPDFLQKYHREPIKRLVDAWHEHGIKVIFHSDGNWKKAVPDLLACGVDGFYCLEPNCGMDIVELKNAYPQVVWSGGVDGVNLMERGVPADVRNTVHRHIYETNALNTGGMFVATSSEINPQIKPENFKAMVEAVGEIVNPDFVR